MGSRNKKVPKIAADGNAGGQHQAVCQFLNEEGTRDKLLGGLTKSLELTLLKELLDSRNPVKSSKFSAENKVSVSGLSGAAERLNRYLEGFSKKLNLCGNKHVTIKIPRRVGGYSVGYYLACFDTKRQEYLDGVATTRLLLRAPTAQVGVTGFRYLRPIEEVLEIGIEQEPKWFRKKGPIAVDFEDNRIYRREERLEELKEMVTNNAVSILEGVAATGKTVLALTLTYDLHKAGEGPVYYFDCDKKRDFDENILVNEIRSTNGIFILENAHLAPEKSQSIFSVCKHDGGRNVLFTCRPTFGEYQYSRGEDLTQIMGLSLEPFEEVDKVIEKYCIHRDTPEIPVEVQEQIKDACSSSLWLVSYALEGCAKAGGVGNAKTWLEAGLKDDLNDLRNIETTFPEILVALAPLYRNEVLTAEDYLTGKLGFDCGVLDKLVQRGEVTSQTTADGVVFYGLPHSGLANAYWEHGQVYRKRRGLPKYEDFICDYVAFNGGNALEAVLKAEETVRDAALRRVCDAEVVPQVIEREIEPSNIALFLSDHYGEVRGIEVLEALSSRVESCCDMVSAGRWFRYIYEGGDAKRFWKLVDQEKLADRLSNCIDIGHTGAFIGIFREIDARAARRLWSKMDLRVYADRISKWPRAYESLGCIYSILYSDGKAGLELWRLLDEGELAGNVSRDSYISSAIHGIVQIYHVNPDVIRKFCERLDWETLAKRVDGLHHLMLVNSSISGLSTVDHIFAKNLCEHVDVEALAIKISETESCWCIYECILEIRNASEVVCNKICQKLDLDKLSAVLCRDNDIKSVAGCISRIKDVEAAIAKRLCELLDLKQLAQKLEEPDSATHACECIARIFAANKDSGCVLWGYLDKDRLAENMVGVKDLKELGGGFRSLCEVNRSLGKELWQRLDLNKLADRLIDTDLYVDFQLCLLGIWFGLPAFAVELCGKFDIERLARKFEGMSGLEFHFCMPALHFAHKDTAKAVCQQFNIQALGTRLLDMDVADCHSFLSEIQKAEPGISKQLCEKIGAENLIRKLEDLELEGTETFVAFLDEAAPKVLDELTKAVENAALKDRIVAACRKARKDKSRTDQ